MTFPFSVPLNYFVSAISFIEWNDKEAMVTVSFSHHLNGGLKTEYGFIPLSNLPTLIEFLNKEGFVKQDTGMPLYLSPQLHREQQ